MKIHSLATQKLAELTKLGGGAVQETGDDFAKQLMDVMREVNSAQNEAVQAKTDFVAGRPVEIHDVMIAMERASVAMNLTMAVRNKMLEAYQEIMRTQV